MVVTSKTRCAKSPIQSIKDETTCLSETQPRETVISASNGSEVLGAKCDKTRNDLGHSLVFHGGRAHARPDVIVIFIYSPDQMEIILLLPHDGK